MRNLELARRNKKLSQAQVAQMARVDQAFVSMIERGVGLPTPNQATRLAAAVGIPPESLTDEVPVPVDTFEAAS